MAAREARHEDKGSWRKLHIAMDADTGQIAAATIIASDVDDASQVGALFDQVDGPVASFTADGAYEADISRFKRVIGDGLRSRTDRRRETEVAIAVDALNRMLGLGRPEYVRLP
jgi:hypothetical protein